MVSVPNISGQGTNFMNRSERDLIFLPRANPNSDSAPAVSPLLVQVNHTGNERARVTDMLHEEPCEGQWSDLALKGSTMTTYKQGSYRGRKRQLPQAAVWPPYTEYEHTSSSHLHNAVQKNIRAGKMVQWVKTLATQARQPGSDS